MNYRQAELLATTSITTAGTKTIDINVGDMISRIMIICELTNNGTTPTGHPADAIKTIEVIDGSEVLLSMSGVEAQAMHFYNGGIPDHNELNYEDNAVCRAAFSLDFGRWLWDELLGLDPTKFRNLQLRIDHNYSLGGCSPDAANLRVLADMFDEKTVTPLGYMLSKEIFSFTPTAGAAEYIELPIDEDLRKLIVLATGDDEEPDIQFETIKIDEEDGKRVILNAKTMDVIRFYAGLYPRFEEYFSGNVAATGRAYYLTQLKDMQIQLQEATDANSTYYRAWSGGRKQTILGELAGNFHGAVSGLCPHGAVPVLFGKQDNPEDWWDMSRIAKARLILTPRATPAIESNPTDVVVQQVKRY